MIHVTTKLYNSAKQFTNVSMGVTVSYVISGNTSYNLPARIPEVQPDD